MKRIKILSSIGLALAFGFSWAGSITGIKMDGLDASQHVVKITFDSVVPKLNSFSTANPPRIAFDFPDTTVRMANPQVTLDNALVKFATVVQGGARARVLLNLNQNANYTTEVQGNDLLIKLNNSANVVANNTMPTEDVIAKSNVKVAPIVSNTQDTSVDFRRSESGAGRLEVSLPTQNMPVDIRRVGDKIVIKLVGAPLPRSQQRKFDVNDFATPVRKVDMFNSGNTGQIILEPTGSWDFTSYQTDKKLVVEVSKKEVSKDAGFLFDPLDSNKNKNYKGQRLSLNFQDVSVREVLQVIAEFTGLNIVTSDSVDGRMTLRLKDVPWDQALALILETRDLDMRQNGNIVRIAPRAEMAVAEKQALQAQDDLQKMGALRTQTFQLKYKDVEAFKKILNITDSGSSASGSNNNSILSSRGSALIDPATNTLIITDTQPVLNDMSRLIKELDVAARQVMIEARIVEAKDGFQRDLGVKLGGRYTKGETSAASNFKDAMENLNSGKGSKEDPFAIGPSVSFPSNIAGAANSSVAIFRRWASGALGLELSAMQIEDKGKIISSPRILTADRQEASIEEGTEIPYQEASSSGATAATFKKAVLNLTVKPQITPDDNVIIDLQISKDSPDGQREGALSVQRINTRVMVENGGTVVIGGIYVQERRNLEHKVPLLGDIPIVGHLFKRKAKEDSRRELLVFITPHVVDQQENNSVRY